jgi:hypothetical protein
VTERRRPVPSLSVHKPEPWERQPDEPDSSWRFFVIYRDLGPGRTLREVAEKAERSRTVIEGTSREWSWQKRARAWDAELDKRRRESAGDEIEKMSRRHARYARENLLILSEPARIFLHRLRNDPSLRQEMHNMPAARLMLLVQRSAAAMQTVMQAERLAMGASTSNVAVHVDDADTEAILGDPEATRLASELFARLAGSGSLGSGDADGSGLPTLGRPTDSGAASSADQ